MSKISVTLTRELAEIVDQAVFSGDYRSSGEVIREALQEWKLRRSPEQSTLNELRTLWAEGVASGPGQFADMEAIKREARDQSRSAQNSTDS